MTVSRLTVVAEVTAAPLSEMVSITACLSAKSDPLLAARAKSATFLPLSRPSLPVPPSNSTMLPEVADAGPLKSPVPAPLEPRSPVRVNWNEIGSLAENAAAPDPSCTVSFT